MDENLMILGLAVFAVAWTVQTIVVLEKKKNLGDIVASLLFFVGLVLLTAASFRVSNPWFLVFNIISAVLALVNLYYIPHKMKSFEKDIWGVGRFVEKEVMGHRQSYQHKRKK
jgi:hypothetical protein